MPHLTLKTPTHFVRLRCAEDLQLLDEATIEVTAPAWLEGGRMAVDVMMIANLVACDDHEGLAEIGIEMLDSISRASLN